MELQHKYLFRYKKCILALINMHAVYIHGFVLSRFRCNELRNNKKKLH